MKEIVERQLIKITDDLIVKRGYVERVVDEEGEVDWLMNGRPISDEHVKEMLEKRLNSVKKKRADEYISEFKEAFNKLIYGEYQYKKNLGNFSNYR